MPFALRNGAHLFWRCDGPAEAPALLLLNSIGTDLAADALAVADAAGIKRFAVAGVSLGGMIALELALLAPDRVTTGLRPASAHCSVVRPVRRNAACAPATSLAAASRLACCSNAAVRSGWPSGKGAAITASSSAAASPGDLPLYIGAAIASRSVAAAIGSAATAG